MAHKTETSVLLIALTLFFMLMLPGTAAAQSATPPDCSQTGDFYKNYTQDLTAAAQAKVAAIHNFYSGIPALDLKANYCIDKIESFFDVAIGMGDITHILGAFATQILTNMLNQVCQAALQYVTTIQQFALSQFNRLCVPLPNLNLNLGSINLQGPACNGVNLLGIKTTTGGQALPPGVWQIWNSNTGAGP